jgi:nitrous oxide reductase accessory protein NosL
MFLTKPLLSFFIIFFSTNLFSYPIISTTVKEKRIYPMGKKIYTKKCKEINPLKYKNYEAMQEDILSKNLCGILNEKYFQALSLYLWDLKRINKSEKIFKEIKVTKNEKCPICGMFVYRYPKWATQIFYENKHYSFDGVKDMMKFYLQRKDVIKEMLVRDYYTQKSIDAKKAYYVVGSDVYGPMGDELIAFKDKDSAKRFMLDHRAKKVIYFDDITKDEVYKLDE